MNAVGSCFPTTRELDTETVAHSSFFTDRRESCLNEAGDYILAAKEGAVGPDHIKAELGEVLAGMHPGREHEDELTIFESLGIAVEDLASAELIVRRRASAASASRFRSDPAGGHRGRARAVSRARSSARRSSACGSTLPPRSG